jgi:hypothetical protein
MMHMQALLNAINSLAGGFAASGAEPDTRMPQLVIIDSFSGVFSPILGRQHMQGTWGSAWFQMVGI